MNDSAFKSDLFDQENLNGKPSKRSALRRYSQQQLLPYVKLPVEFLIMGAIFFLVALVVVYAVGVEVGKKRVSPEAAISEKVYTEVTAESEFSSSLSEEQQVVPDVSIPDKVVQDVPVAPVEDNPTVEEPEKTDPPRYLIQLASYRTRKVAETKRDVLEDKGYEAKVKKSNDWYQLLVYGYKNIEEAKAARKKFQQEYQDCFIRNIE